MTWIHRTTSSPATVARRAVVALLFVVLSAVPAAAHASGLSGPRQTLTIPHWLILLTGGAVIGASFLLVSMVTDRQLIQAIHDWGWGRSVSFPRWLPSVGRLVGLAILVEVVVVGFIGPQTETVSFTILFVWVAWWAGYTMSVYLVGNTWPSLNPWRMVADAIPASPLVAYPDRLGSWPSVVGLFVLVWLEVASPIAERPSVLATLVLVYSAVTVAGAVVFGVEPWFEWVDPVSRVFRFYGRVAPFQRTPDGIEVGLPGWRLATGQFVDGWDDVAFVVGVLWLTTFDGFVSTPSWRAIVTPVVGLGVPAHFAYVGLLVVGYALFLGAFYLASTYATRWAATLLSSRTVAFRFAQSLLPIAAGYHLAHYLGYLLSFGPSVAVIAASPLAPPATVPSIVVPAWYPVVQLAAVLAGHVVAIWIAHSIAFGSFTGRLQPIRSQYAFSVVMVCFTMIAVGIVYQPEVPVPFL